MNLPSRLNGPKYMRGAWAIALMGLIIFLIGLFLFSNLSSDHNEQFHSDLIERIGSGAFTILFMLVGLIFFVVGLLSGPMKSTSQPKSLAGKAKSLLVAALVIYAIFFPHDWNWEKLKDYYSDTVYVTFPKNGYHIDQIGHTHFKPVFFNYKPSWMGNGEKHYLSIDHDQYKLTLEALDSFGKDSVTVVDDGLHINQLGHYLFKASVKQSAPGQYKIKRYYADDHQLVYLNHKLNTEQWKPLAEDNLPANLQQKANILEEFFVTDRAGGLTKLGNTFYINNSGSFHSRGQGSVFSPGYYTIAVGNGITTTRWPKMPANMYHNVIHSHQGLIYSFGGIEHNSNHAAPGNWVYYPKKNKWAKLSPPPIFNQTKNQYPPSVASVYTANDKLYVLTLDKTYRLYQFDLNADNTADQWKLVKQFSLPSPLTNWR
jgi:hypothetical protein